MDDTYDFPDDLIACGDCPDELISKELIEFANYPKDDMSLYILRLTSLHLSNMSDEQKRTVIAGWQKALGIKPFISDQIGAPSCISSKTSKNNTNQKS